METDNRMRGCQIIGVILTVLLLATVCWIAGLALGGGIGLVTGGTVGYAVGQTQAGPEAPPPPIELPIPELPQPEPPTPPQPEMPEDMPDFNVRPYLGVRYQQVENGAELLSVDPGSPAQGAGLRAGDVIQAVDGRPVGAGEPTLTERIMRYAPEDTVELNVLRAGEEITVDVTLGMKMEGGPPFSIPPEAPEAPEMGRAFLGVRSQALEEGAEITAVMPNSPAQEADLRVGDVILAVDGEAVTPGTPLLFLILQHRPGDIVELTIERDGRERVIEAQLASWADLPQPEEQREG